MPADWSRLALGYLVICLPKVTRAQAPEFWEFTKFAVSFMYRLWQNSQHPVSRSTGVSHWICLVEILNVEH